MTNVIVTTQQEVEKNTIVPFVDKVFYFEEFEQAFEYINDPTKKKFGKIVLKLREKSWHEE
jgi:NADPH:quinone reductase-like Zn-dependent oxidoreductase